MEQLLEQSTLVLDRVVEKIIPKQQLRTCAGLVLVTSHQVGFVAASYSAGAGVLLSHLDDKWSAPVAISIGSVGLGAVLGRADTQLAIVLNPLAMRSLIESPSGCLQFGGNLGLTLGRGMEGGVDVSVAQGGKGWASSIVYTLSKGIMISAKVETGSLTFVHPVNETFYGTSDVAEILEGLASTPPGPAAHMVDRLTSLTE